LATNSEPMPSLAPNPSLTWRPFTSFYGTVLYIHRCEEAERDLKDPDPNANIILTIIIMCEQLQIGSVMWLRRGPSSITPSSNNLYLGSWILLAYLPLHYAECYK
jgi:hypothetical protein